MKVKPKMIKRARGRVKTLQPKRTIKRPSTKRRSSAAYRRGYKSGYAKGFEAGCEKAYTAN